jgi:hypothetical protein
MSYTYLLEQGEESLAASYSDIPLSVLSKLNPIAEKCCSNDNETASCQSFPSGMMSAPSTESRGEERLMSSVVDSPAKTLVSQEKEQESQESVVDSGAKWHASFARWDRHSYSWKTRQCLLFEDLELSLETWPRWGMMQNGECSEPLIAVHLTNESVYGSWPTPRCQMTRPVRGRADQPKGHKGNLEEVVYVRTWPTPCASEYKENRTRPLWKKGTQIWLTTAVLAGGKATPLTYLNPNWVEWLMGWPIGWTDLKLLEMDKYQQWQHSHGELYHNERP